MEWSLQVTHTSGQTKSKKLQFEVKFIKNMGYLTRKEGTKTISKIFIENIKIDFYILEINIIMRQQTCHIIQIRLRI